MHPPHSRPPTESPGTDRSLASAFVACVLTVVSFSAALVTATTVAAVAAGPPPVVASVALTVGFATVLAVPVGTSIGARRLLERYRRRDPRSVADGPSHPDPRPETR